jgi:hypothetical protein
MVINPPEGGFFFAGFFNEYEILSEVSTTEW